MTGGWQGDQGGWQPPQDPYQQQQYGPPYDPYGQYQQQDPHAAPGYQGWGYQEPPPKKSKLPIVLSLIAIVAIIGGVVAIVLLNRDDDPSPAANVTSSTTDTPAPTTRRPPPSSDVNAPSGDCVEVASSIGKYCAPADWKPSTEKRASGLGIDFDGGAVFGEYDCGGSSYWRGFTATGQVQGKDGAQLDLNKAVTDFATSFAKEGYRNPQLDGATPTPVKVGGKDAASIRMKLTVQPANAECDATGGEVVVLGLPVEESGKLIGVDMLVVVDDLAGGPANPPPLNESAADEILKSFKPS